MKTSISSLYLKWDNSTYVVVDVENVVTWIHSNRLFEYSFVIVMFDVVV